jgi:hypothetical protein
MAQAAVWMKDWNEAAVLRQQAADILDQVNTQYGMEMYNMAGIVLEGNTP